MTKRKNGGGRIGELVQTDPATAGLNRCHMIKAKSVLWSCVGALPEFFKKRRRSGPRELSTNVTLTEVQEQLKALGIPWSTFVAYAALPDKLTRIIDAYSATLANLPERPLLHPISALPYPKETIEAAIKESRISQKTRGLKPGCKRVCLV